MNRIQKQIIKEAIDCPERLTEWEFDFINDLPGKDDDYELSEQQNHIVNRIGSKM